MEAKLIKHGHSYALILEDKLVAFAHPEDFRSDAEIGKLSLKNCQAIERGYDLDELVENEENRHYALGLKHGFQKAVELMGDKKFTEEDVRIGMDRVWSWCNGGIYQECTLMSYVKDKHIQSLQQNEWEVEIDMTPYHDNNFINDGKTHIIKPIFKPTLDSEGCLILKRI